MPLPSHVTFHTAQFSQPMSSTEIELPKPAGARVWYTGPTVDWQPSGIPRVRRTQIHWFGIWDSEQAADAFLERADQYITPALKATDFWSVKLSPYQHNGGMMFDGALHQLEVGEQAAIVKPAADEPVFTLTSVCPIATMTTALEFGKHTYASRRTLLEAAGMLGDWQLLANDPSTNSSLTVTAWQSEQAALDWAFNDPAHRAAMVFTHRTIDMKMVSFSRLRIGTAKGRWHGADKPAWA